MTLNELQRHRDAIERLADSYGARNLRVFGSVARGEASRESDVDLLVDLGAERSLLDLGGLLVALEGLLECKVDVTTEGMLRARIRDQALSEAVPL